MDLKGVKVVVMDVDGTIFKHWKMRLCIARDLLAHYLFRPKAWGDLRIIREFRRQREKLAGRKMIGLSAYEFQALAQKLGLEAGRVRDVIWRWIYRQPLAHLPKCKNDEIIKFIYSAAESEKKIVYFSDYPAQEKVDVLGLPNDFILCATDEMVNAFKPSTVGLEIIFSRYGITPRECLVVGDRDSRDGEMARRAGAFFIHAKNIGQYLEGFKAGV